MTSYDTLILNIWKDVKLFIKQKDENLDDLAYQLLTRFDEEGIEIEKLVDNIKDRDTNLNNGLKELVGDIGDYDGTDENDEDFNRYMQSNGEYGDDE